jgi:ribonuclease P protein component
VDIAACRDRGEKLYTKHFLLLVLPASSSESRLAVAVTTKIEKRAVVRNKIKRRLRELFRVTRSQFKQPVDVLVVARRDVQSCSFADYRREILGALNAHGLLKPR